MRKLASILCGALSLALLYLLLALPVSAAAPSGKWTDESYAENTAWYTNYQDSPSFTISTPERLASVAKLVNESGKDFNGKILVIGKNLDLSAHYWVPIGTPEHPFRGTIRTDEGQSITGMYISSACAVEHESVRYYGLVGCGEGATVTNMTLSGAITVTGAAGKTDIVGAAIAWAKGNGIANSEVSKLTNGVEIRAAGANNTAVGRATIGGIVGRSSDSKLSGCVNNGAITVNTMEAVTVGGLIGEVDGTTVIAGNIASGACRNDSALNVTAADATVGGIAGVVSAQTLSLTEDSGSEAVPGAKYIWSLGNLKVNASVGADVGGYIGAITGTGVCDIVNANYTREISVSGDGNANVGGILGLHSAAAESSLTDCRFTTGFTVADNNGKTLIAEDYASTRIVVSSKGTVFTGGIYGHASKLKVVTPVLGSETEATKCVPVIQSTENVGGVGGNYLAGAVYTDGPVTISRLSVQAKGMNCSIGGAFGTADGLKALNLIAGSLNVELDSDKDNTSDSSNIGGIVGKLSGNATDGTIRVLGSVQVSSKGNGCNIGGFAGQNTGALKNISMGDHTTVRCSQGNGSSMGGFIGYNAGSIDFCYSTAELTTKNTSGTTSISLINLSLGGLIGTNSGTVSNCYRDMEVTAASIKSEDILSSCIGGLVGANSGTVRSCFALCDVDLSRITRSSAYGGGLIGWMSSGSVQDCYCAEHTVTGNASFGTVGGFIGRLDASAAVANCYSAMTVAGGGTKGGFIGQANGANAPLSCVYLNNGLPGASSDPAWTDEQLKAVSQSALTMEETFSGWDFIHFDDHGELQGAWRISHTAGRAYSYPVLLRWSNDSASINYDLRWFTENMNSDTFAVCSEAELSGLVMLVNGEMTALNDGAPIDFAGKTVRVGKAFNLQLAQWTPIGKSNARFQGSFDGNRFLIDGLCMTDTNAADAGLFGSTGTNANLSNLTLEVLTVSGSANVGVLAAVNGGTITPPTLYLSGMLRAAGESGNVGGIAGTNETGAHINGQYAIPQVTIKATGAAGLTGGIAGNNKGEINGADVSVKAQIEATGANGGAGGVAGANSGTIAELRLTFDADASVMAAASGGVAGVNRAEIENATISAPEAVEICSNDANGCAGGVSGINDGTGTISGALQLSRINISSSENAGGVAGKNNGLIGETTVTEIAVAIAGNSAGGVAGQNGAVIRAVTAMGSAVVNGTECAGGLIGQQTAGGTFSDATVQGIAVFGESNVGGAVGKAVGTLVNNAPSILNVTVTSLAVSGNDASNVGGVIGYADGVMASGLTGRGLTINASTEQTGLLACGGVAGFTDSSVLRGVSTDSMSLNVDTSTAGVCVGGAVGKIRVTGNENRTYTLTAEDKLGVYQGVTDAALTNLTVNVIGAQDAVGEQNACVGGLVGQTEQGCIYDSSVVGDLGAGGFAKLSAGGAVGQASGAYLVNNSAGCRLTLGYAKEYEAGGLIGKLSNGTACLNRVSTSVPVRVVHGADAMTGAISAGGFAGLIENAGDWTVRENSAAQPVMVTCGYDGADLYVGSFAGQIKGKVSACYAMGDSTVDGMDDAKAGGFVGRLQGQLDSCYASANQISVSGRNAVGGGFAGAILGGSNVSNCYAVDSTISATGQENASAGAFAGNAADGTLTAVYADVTIVRSKTGAAAFISGENTVIVQEQDSDTRLNSGTHLTGFDFGSASRKWFYLSGKNRNRPVLTALESWDAWPDLAMLRQQGTSALTVDSAAQFGTAARLLSDPEFAKLLTDNRVGRGAVSAELSGDIDLNGKLWNPIAQLNAGDVLDGQNHTLRGLCSEAASYDNYGLVMTNNGTIQNIIISKAAVNAGSPAGLAAGTNAGTVQNVTVTNSTLNGTGVAGAAVGVNAGTMTGIAVSSDVTVNGTTVGGIAGTNSGTLTASKSDAAVNGSETAGGVVGVNQAGGTVGAAESGQGDVTSNATVHAPTAGGVAGSNAGTVQNSDTVSAEDQIQGTTQHGRITGDGSSFAVNCREGQCAAPIAISASRGFYDKVTVTLASDTEDATIYYTLDGTEPTTASILYIGEFELTDSTTVKSFAVKDRLVDSVVASVTFTKLYPNTTVPVSGGNGSANMEVSVSGNTVSVAEINAKTVDSIAGGDDVPDTVIVDVSGLSARINAVVLTADSLRMIAENGDNALTLKMKTGTVTFDAEALDSIAGSVNSEDVTFSLREISASDLTDAQQSALKDLNILKIEDIFVLADSGKLSEFGGEAIIRIPYTLQDGQDERGIVVWYLAEDGSRTEIPSSYSDGFVRFAVSHFSNYVVAYDAEKAAACPQDETCPISAFTDADPTAWYHDGVHWALESKIMNGVGDNKFAPSSTTSRAMIVTILYRLENEPEVTAENPFDDVEDGKWYTDAVTWAAEHKIVEGYDGKFAPNDSITREQFAAILYRYAQYKGLDVSVGEDTNILSFGDALEVSGWANAAMQWAVGSGIINGKDGNLVPKGDASRAEAATMLMRYSTLVTK